MTQVGDRVAESATGDQNDQPQDGQVTRDPLTPSPMPSVDKALRAVMELAEVGATGLALADLADRLGVKRSSLHVTLRALRHRNFVRQEAGSGHYVLGSSVLAAAALYSKDFDLRGALRPALVALADELNEVVHLAVLDGTDMLYLEKIESRRPIQPGTSIGMRRPALTTAMGRALIAAQFPTFEGFRRRFAGALVPHTAQSPRTLEAEWERVVAARRPGYAVDLEENVVGLTAVAIALTLNETPTAAVSVVTLASDFHEKGEMYFADRLRERIESAVSAPLAVVQPLKDGRP